MFSEEDLKDQPRGWSEMSLDGKFIFGIHALLILMFVVGGALSVPAEIAIAGAAYGVAVVVSILNRRRSGWRWPGAGWKQWLGALAGLLLAGIFLTVVGSLTAPNDARGVPFFIAAAGIAAFSVLRSLRLVRFSQAFFAQDCGPPRTVPAARTPTVAEAGAGWKKTLLRVAQVWFVAAWLVGMAFFYMFATSVRDGAVAPTATYSARIINHGEVRYVTAQRKRLLDLLQLGMFIGIPPAVIGMLALRAFGIGGPNPFARR